MSKVFEDLEEAEAALTRAVGKLNRMTGGRMPNRTLWVGQMAEQRRAVSLLLKLRALTEKVKYHGA